MPTIAISSLKTTCRNVERRWGSVIRKMRASEPGSDALAELCNEELTEALVVDPTGTPMRLVHKFSRTPVLSLSLTCDDVATSAREWRRRLCRPAGLTPSSV